MNMECTQRLECTQELHETTTERVCPEQIGFLGICGTKYPVKRGPNKIGRDPQTCNIVLQLESISRQHAVINILNKSEFMLMDLDSANKTKLLNKTLQPYIPHPLRNGDMVQFGNVFGVFRLLEEDNDLPMTQALDIPDTPIMSKHMSRIKDIPITTIPESPEVSDRDDSFIAPSQPKSHKPFKNDSNHFIKHCTKTISMQPVGSNKINNIYWNSSKKSTSIGSTFDESDQSLNDSGLKSISNLHDMETQPPQNMNMSLYEMETQGPSNVVNLHEADTQAPFGEHVDSIYTANTQLPKGNATPSIHNLATQIPESDNLPAICKIVEQQDMQFDLCSRNKENVNINNSETQNMLEKQNMLTKDNINDNDNSKSIDTVKPNKSEEEILFDEIDNDEFQNDFESQSLLPESPKKTFNDDSIKTVPNKGNSDISNPSKREVQIQSDSSTDCDDFEILPTQQLPQQPVDEDLTDCEDEVTENSKKNNGSVSHNPNVNFEDMLTQVIDNSPPSNNTNKNSNSDQVKLGNLPAANNHTVEFEDMLTQVIEEDLPFNNKIVDKLSFEEMPTQVIEERSSKLHQKEHEPIDIEDLPTQVLDNDFDTGKNAKPIKITEDFISPFKIPLISPIKVKRKDILKTYSVKEVSPIKKSKVLNDKSDDNYYAATQELFDDLCTQPENPQIVNRGDKTEDDEVVPCSVEEVGIGEFKFPCLDDAVSPKKISRSATPLYRMSNENVDKFVNNLSTQEIRNIIGADVTKLKRQNSDLSDVDSTPKKLRSVNFFEIELPNSQEIKSSVTLHAKTALSVSPSESESENESEEQNTPILFRNKKKPKVKDAKVDLMKKFDVDTLPTRIITRVRKPTAKFNDQNSKVSDSILKPKFLTEQEGDIDKDIISENISRLKNSKSEKGKSQKDAKITEKEKVKNSEQSNERSTKSRSTKNKKQETKDKTEKTAPKTNQSLMNQYLIPDDDVKTILDKKSIKDKPKNTRSTRNKNIDSDKKSSDNIKDEDNSKYPEKRTRRKVNNTSNHTLAPETEVRRSKRHTSSKEKADSVIKVKITKPPKKKPAHEQSTVYSISSDSGAESPKGLKRSATEVLRAPSPKRTRSNASSSRSTGKPETHYVLFTAFPCDEVKLKLEKLGAVIVTDVTKCTVLLTMHIKRTFKLLCAVGLGRPIVGPSWVQACADNNTIVDPWLYLIKDSAVEERFKFNLQKSLLGKRNFLKGYNVSSTPSVMPSSPEMKLIVESSGGSWKEEGSQWLCVSCAADKSLWPALKRRGATIVSTEIILGGVLRQNLDIRGNKIS